jgi:hypothetical protein
MKGIPKLLGFKENKKDTMPARVSEVFSWTALLTHFDDVVSARIIFNELQLWWWDGNNT